MSGEGYRYASVDELAARLRNGDVSAGELADSALSLLAELGAPLNAVASLLPDRARQEAGAADEALRGGEAPLLCGIPYAVKDLFAATGGPTTWGSPMFSDQQFSTDAVAVRRLASQGAVLTAKLAMSELAGGGEPSRAGASLHGQGRNPWDVDRYSGGSSSGSGIAVALGLVPFALGTETGGSIVGPAAFTGVTGLRPSFGTVPRGGVMSLAFSLDKVGPLARSAADCAIVMDAIADEDRGGGGFVKGMAAVREAPPESIRVAFAPIELEEAAPSIQDAARAGLDAFRAVFPTFVDAELERDPRYVSALLDIIRVEGAFAFREHLSNADFRMTDAEQQSKLASGLDVRAVDYLEAALTIRSEAERAFGRLFEVADVVLSVSRPAVAQRLDAPRAPRDAAKLSDLLRAAANLTGLPGVSVPCGLSEEGLPVGLHLLGPRGSDARLLGIAARFQEATTFHRLRPPDPAPGR